MTRAWHGNHGHWNRFTRSCFLMHLIRYSMQFASWKERKAIATALRPIYQAETAELAAGRLEDFDVGE